MAEPSSQNTSTRQPRPDRHGNRERHLLVSLLGGLAFLLAAGFTLDYFAKSELGRTIDSHLTRLADPQSWIQ